MNRRDLETVARTIRQLPTGAAQPAIVAKFVEALGLSGDARAKFLKACGIEPKKPWDELRDGVF